MGLFFVEGSEIPVPNQVEPQRDGHVFSVSCAIF